MKNHDLEDAMTYFIFGICGLIIIFGGIIAITKKLYIIGIIFLMFGGFLRFKYKLRKKVRYIR